MPKTARNALPRTARLRWIDSAWTAGWGRENDAEDYKPLKVTTIGFVIREDDEAIVLAQGISTEGEYLNVVVVPKVAILK